MTTASALVENLLSRQNGDGGWGFAAAAPVPASWTEPTALALLALEAADASGCRAHASGRDWLLARQRPDGGWSPCSPVQTSTSVTSASTLALASFCSENSQKRAIQWLLQQVKPDLGALQRVEFWLADMPSKELVMGGSPWFPGTAAWVAPTVMAALAFAQARRNSSFSDLDLQIHRAAEYLLSRRCQDGGWNHGGTLFRSAAAFSYPEMTGMALLAIPPRAPTLGSTLALAEQMFRRPGSSEGQSWLHLGLVKHGRHSEPSMQNLLPCRTTRDLCLQVIALSARSASNKLLTSTA